jgi:hypothetical protein
VQLGVYAPVELFNCAKGHTLGNRRFRENDVEPSNSVLPLEAWILRKDTVVNVLSGRLETIDSIQLNLMLASDHDVAAFFTIECDGITVNGNEHIHLDESGLIDRFEVAWRLLASAVFIQEQLANKLARTANAFSSRVKGCVIESQNRTITTASFFNLIMIRTR